MLLEHAIHSHWCPAHHSSVVAVSLHGLPHVMTPTWRLCLAACCLMRKVDLAPLLSECCAANLTVPAIQMASLQCLGTKHNVP